MTYTHDNISAYTLVKLGYFPTEPENKHSSLIDFNYHYEKQGEKAGRAAVRDHIRDLKDRMSRYVDTKYRTAHLDVIQCMEQRLRLREKYGVGVKAQS